jgi:chromosome partitioning protein
MKVGVCNIKGGVGKTTTAINTAACLALSGKKTLIVDSDPQGAATEGLGIDQWMPEKTMYDVFMDEISIEDVVIGTEIKGLYLAPSNLNLSGAEVELASVLGRETILRRALKNADYDYIFIDTPPNPGILTVNAMVTCDLLIMPLQCEFYAMIGAKQLLDMAGRVKKALGNDPQKKILLTMYDARTKLSKEVADGIRAKFGDMVFKTIIPNNVRLAEAPANGQPICLYDPASYGAIAYKELAEEILCLA